MCRFYPHVGCNAGVQAHFNFPTVAPIVADVQQQNTLLLDVGNAIKQSSNLGTNILLTSVGSCFSFL